MAVLLGTCEDVLEIHDERVWMLIDVPRHVRVFIGKTSPTEILHPLGRHVCEPEVLVEVQVLDCSRVDLA
jgi:hypothetical protein